MMSKPAYLSVEIVTDKPTSGKISIPQAVKPHIPSIKFPNRSKEAAISLTQSGLPQTQPPQPQTASTPRGPSLGDLDFLNLPKKYQRKPISPEEMAYIERGGPE